jgi:diguanylate cyclase (GGDEF)-like protein
MLEGELTRARREARPVGVMLADLDYFKTINDSHGHLAGDAVLQEASRRIHAATRPYDMIGRYGGEEFLIVLPGCDRDSTLKIAGRIRERLAAEPVPYKGQSIPVTTSLGVVSYHVGPEAVDINGLLHLADTALYRAKYAGRNRVEAAPLAECSSLPGK